MSPEEKIEAAQKLIDEARAEIAAKKRNWPEEIRFGMDHDVFAIKIADDAREPTGAELVGKVCQVSLSPINKPNGGIRCLVTSFDPIIGYRTEEGENTPWKYARLAR